MSKYIISIEFEEQDDGGTGVSIKSDPPLAGPDVAAYMQAQYGEERPERISQAHGMAIEWFGAIVELYQSLAEDDG